jgi:hypothetical protein
MDLSHALFARQQEAGRRWRVFPGSMIAEPGDWKGPSQELRIGPARGQH